MPRRGVDDTRHLYEVSDVRLHPKGHTEYKVVVKVFSQKRPADVQETVVWRRYSDFRKLHRDLLYIHRNLFRKEEEFPTFPKPTMFGRFEEAVIKERRKSAEELLRFASTITALHNSKQLKSFFEGGEEKLPSATNAPAGLPEPLVPLPRAESVPTSCLTGPFVEPSSWKHSGSFDEDALLGLDVLPDLPEDGTPEPKLQDDWLSVLREEESSVETRGQPMADSRWQEDGMPAGQTWAPGQCVTMAGQKVRLAMEKEAAGLHREAFGLYKAAVDVLLQGMQGDPSPERRKMVELKTAQYLQRAKAIFQEHLKDSGPMGAEEGL
uniref:sorting nexin-15-like isoform X2 n=1 Tax=Myxine glutinosa TaxID=7769 RepID=UPI00358E0EA8